MAGSYTRRLLELEDFAWQLGLEWACHDCGTDDFPLSFYPPTEETIARRLTRKPDWDAFAKDLSERQLLCRQCRNRRDRASARGAAARRAKAVAS